MPETKQWIERAAQHAPSPAFSLDDVRRRRGRLDRRRRLTAGAVAGGITLALVALALTSFGPLGADERQHVALGGIGLPPATREPVAIGSNGYSYQHLLYTIGWPCEGQGRDQGCPDSRLDLESWWKADGSGRIAVHEQHNYGVEAGTFAPGEFHTEGDLSGFPFDPDALGPFLLERSGENGASPRPDVTPSPGVPLEEGLLWNAIRDYLGSTQYLNTTPSLRASMLEVLATVPMVNVDLQAQDPVGRDAIALRFVAYAEDIVVFVDPATHDFLGMTETSPESGSVGTILVASAGETLATDATPTGADRSVPTAP
ncbi:MAG: hypothetical protein M3O29_00045 [Actinomycetota bacterium]|nr:hypothetical protein [Actinomycetota bacterium]